jgi:uncharacterized protein
VLVDFLLHLKARGLPISLREHLGLVEALGHGLADRSMEGFYHLARTCLVKDETLYDRFDRAFGEYFEGIDTLDPQAPRSLPEEWLRRLAELHLSEEDRRRVEALGGWEQLMETLRERLATQSARHQGGSKWIGTAGTSPFGAWGYNPEGVRIGQDRSRHRRAVKVWDRREYRNLDGSVELGTRTLKLALRRLRRFAREGAEEELDLDDTIRATARNAGLLDLRLRPERRNAVKLLLLLDIGGSMDDHVERCEQLFSAARSEFRHLVHFYFHNCPYEGLWKDNRRRHEERIPTREVIHTYGRDHRLVLVGDATMSPYEVAMAGGSVEHWNEEPGSVWLERLLGAWPRAVWLNPEPRDRWERTPSIRLIRELMGGRMYALTLDGLERAIEALQRPATAAAPVEPPPAPPPH